MEAARSIIAGRLANCRTVLLRSARDARDSGRAGRLQATAKRLAANLIDVKAADKADRLRGGLDA